MMFDSTDSKSHSESISQPDEFKASSPQLSLTRVKGSAKSSTPAHTTEECHSSRRRPTYSGVDSDRS
jgi:hypothetical protein